MNPNTMDRIRSRTVETPTGCLLWDGQRSKKGYGLITIYPGRKIRRVHQVAWELLRGPRPPGLVPDHLCRVPHCWNPDHLEWVTNRENILRGEGATAVNARKTHCPRGHPLEEGNLRIRKNRPSGERECLTCHKLRRRGKLVI